MNERMKDYLRREVSVALEIMLRDNAAFHVFDVDNKGEYVFLSAIIPKAVVGPLERFLKPSRPLGHDSDSERAATPVQRETTERSA